MTDLATKTETELPQEQLVRQLSAVLNTYLDRDQIDKVIEAYHLGAMAHANQYRLSGEAYICHPLSVALILAELRMDANAIMAGILHDVIEDTEVTKEMIFERFGESVADLVDGVSKLTQLDCKSRDEAQAENVRKMFLAMARDLRVIMVKLADRVHNMRTLGIMPPEKKRRIARETMEIYVPLASRLGMNKIRNELTDLGFAAMYPMRYKVLAKAVKAARGHRKEVVRTIEATIRKRLEESAVVCEVTGREKHLYSIYRKMVSKRISLSEVFDVYGCRLVVETTDDCYRALGVMHTLYKPVPGRFKDYIALPKENGYQSLHTVLVGPYGLLLEIQIRTRDMHRMAESGIAAHWLYKGATSDLNHSHEPANEWLRNLLEIQKSAGDSLEFIDNLKVDLFPQQVYVFTPKGSIVKLPKGATILDFAYAVHTDVGNSAVSARIDKCLAPLQTRLENGRTVEVITAEWARPNPMWLKFVVTLKARAAIRTYMRNFKQKEAIALGRRLLDKELSATGVQLSEISPERIDHALQLMKYGCMDALLEDIGLGNRMPFLVARRFVADDQLKDSIGENTGRGSGSPLIIKGAEDMVINLAKCCRPIPGDPIVGFFNPGKGIVIHLNECKNAKIKQRHNNSWLDVEWDQNVEGEFTVEIRLEVKNKRGTLATIATTISAMDSSIETVDIRNQNDELSVDYMIFTVRDRVHLARIMRKLRQLPIVVKISRVKL
ncbi:MAG: bifunctional (p)ppGpp synthetase/guanosine-3',5'-bis(diphosphate) 3'-pyrophosphohydrolase [Methylococcaceae bacterium]|nr:bifunctional (p)ppGpp synthetase/guanosine-3',5'-bis(diphosphate) 3'-pyrophosphohydrolase [Methylococcaceae bacterium]